MEKTDLVGTGSYWQKRLNARESLGLVSQQSCLEMKFLDTSSTKDYSQSLLKKTILFSGFKNPYKKSAKHGNPSYL
jgi:hypothetical protein